MVLSKFFFSVFLWFFLQTSTNADVCQEVSCGDVRVDFRFRLRGQPDCCGNPNFDLSCRNQSQTTITFPFSGEFNVEIIDYYSPNLLISDPQNCVGKRLLQGFDLSGTPFEPRYPESYIFLNCSSKVSVGYPALYFLCLSGTNSSVLAIPTIAYNQSSLLWRSCREIATIFVPLSTIDWSEYYLDDLLLTWEEPECSSSCNGCGSHSRNCDGCYNSIKKSGLSSGTKFALIFILGTPILLIMVVIIHVNIKVHCNDQHHQQSAFEISSLAAERQLPTSTVNCLDGSSIEAYPITLLGESCRLPRPNDNTCSICLSEYQAKETIRTIPDCDHYFHAECIDKWLRLNAACPVCRNMPDQRSALIIHPTESSSSPLPV